MEALVYTFLLIGTLIVIFFAIFFRDPPRIVKKYLDLMIQRGFPTSSVAFFPYAAEDRET